MYQQTLQLHENDREDHAKRLGLTRLEFDTLLISANNAYDIIRRLGPFYGKEEIIDPTFRTTATPVVLPEGSHDVLSLLGDDILHLARALPSLPDEVKQKLGEDLDYRVPLTWRIDAIITKEGELRVNEVECVDSASALMMAEQFAYNLQKVENTTAAKLITAFKSVCPNFKGDTIRLALIRNDLANNLHTSNHVRFIEYIERISNGEIKIDLVDEERLRTASDMPDWTIYQGIMNETSLSPKELREVGITQAQLISAGNFSALNNKGVFAILFDESLTSFWHEHLGYKRLLRLQKHFIPTQFIQSEDDIDKARKCGKVVKASWAGTNTVLINRSKGVAIPTGETVHSSDERWISLKELFNQGVTLISQEFVEPARMLTFLRKKGITLEAVEWYNRVCVKYVAESDPNSEDVPSVSVTATEVTLGPDVVPAGRQCAFTAGAF